MSGGMPRMIPPPLGPILLRQSLTGQRAPSSEPQESQHWDPYLHLIPVFDPSAGSTGIQLERYESARERRSLADHGYGGDRMMVSARSKSASGGGSDEAADKPHCPLPSACEAQGYSLWYKTRSSDTRQYPSGERNR